jgi:hypothetical protein
MTAAHTFREEALRQLGDDILSFGWLRQIAERYFRHQVGAESRLAVFDLVQDLVESGIVVVGSARNNGSIVLIDPWHEKGEALRTRLEREVEAASPGDQDWVFWLQLAKHYNEK